jgi:protein-disulfide isomerase
MELLQQKYGGDLRVVFKHHPLPFHDRAGPAAGLALEAYRELGNAAFWQATRSLFEAPREALTDASLESLGKALKLNPKKVRAALQLGAKDPVILADIALADALSAPGTPAFFVNGQKLVGAQPLAVFEDAVEAQLVAARAMVKAGAARSEVYERIMTLAGGR